MNCKIEISKGSRLKYEENEKGDIYLDRVLPLGLAYPGNYGFIPDTLADDGDCLDILIVTEYEINPGSFLQFRPIGVLKMKDEKGLDEKIIAVPAYSVDPTYCDITDINDIPNRTRDEIKTFFSTYKDLEPNKWSEVDNYYDNYEAYRLIQKYKDRLSNANVSGSYSTFINF